MSSEPLRYRPWWMAGGVGLVLLVIYLSLTSDPVAGHNLGQLNLNHLLAYGVTMLWLDQVVDRSWNRLAVAAGLCSMGVALEFIQGWTGYRHFSYADMGSNALGVAIGLALGEPLRGRLFQRLERAIAAIRS